MALLSGEVETRPPWLCWCPPQPYRMALLSGEVETRATSPAEPCWAMRSGWLRYPGKLKRLVEGGYSDAPPKVPDGFAIRGS